MGIRRSCAGRTSSNRTKPRVRLFQGSKQKKQQLLTKVSTPPTPIVKKEQTFVTPGNDKQTKDEVEFLGVVANAPRKPRKPKQSKQPKQPEELSVPTVPTVEVKTEPGLDS